MDDRLNNIHPIRVFDPIYELVSKKGLLTSDLNTKVEAVNSQEQVSTVFKSAFTRLTEYKSVNLDPTVLAYALRSTLLSIFPDSSVPILSPELVENQVISGMNLNASSGYPKYQKKRLLISEIKRLVSAMRSGSLNVSG